MSKDLYESDVHVFGTRSKNTSVLIKAAPGKTLIVEGSFTGDEALPTGQIKIGNASNISESRTITGDVSLSQTGVVTLDTVNSNPGTTTLSSVTTNGKGLVTANTSATLDNAKVWIGSASNVPTQQSISGDASLAADGTMTLATVTSALNDVNLARVSVDAKGRIISTSTTPLGSGQVFIGNISNVPTANAISGDVTLSNTGVVTLGTVPPAKGGTGLTATPTNGQIPIGNGSGYSLNTLSATNGLAITNGSGTSSIGFTPNIQIPLTYLVVGGGGAGAINGGGGGGGGGLIAGTQVLSTATTLNIIVGNGGSTSGANGANSQIAGSGFTTQTAIGGGGGSAYTAASGGSGGGGGISSPGGSGTAGQGSSGGSGAAGSGGGGGGAGAAGVNGVGNNGGSGGVGLANSITGSTVFYAGGGGGSGLSSAGAGGNGGGGAGTIAGTATAGTANTGGGGGGSLLTTFGAGGRGIVIIRVPTIYYFTCLGFTTETVVGNDTVISFSQGTGTLVLKNFSTSGVSINNSLEISGTERIYNQTASSSTTTGALRVDGGVGVVGTLNAGGVGVTGTLTAGEVGVTGTLTAGNLTLINRSYGYVYGRTGAQSIGTTATTLTSYWNGPPTVSGGVSFSSGVFTVSKAGIYNVSATVVLGSSNIGVIGIFFIINNQDPINFSSSVPAYGFFTAQSPISGSTSIGSSTNLFLNTNDNVRVRVYAGTNTTTGDYWPGWFTIVGI